MSSDLYTVRVFFEGDRGIVKVPGLVPGIRGIERRITKPPDIPGLPELAAIDYAPEVVAQLAPFAGPRRDMEAAEILAVREWIKLLQQGFIV